MAKPQAKGATFEKEVEAVLRLKGYRVSRNELISGTQIDIVAHRDGVLDAQCLVVECADRNEPIGVPLLKEKASILLELSGAAQLTRLLFVARSGFSAEAKVFASQNPRLLLMTMEELENTIIDFSSYAEWYFTNYEKSLTIFREGNLYGHYVELVARDSNREIVGPLTAYVRQWLSESQDDLLFILGEYGAGKTSFCRQLAYSLLCDRYRGDCLGGFVPLLINLRDFRTAFNIQQVITDTLINLYGVPVTSFHAFERLCGAGKILLILDGFDEMASRSDLETLVNCFGQVFLLSNLGAKVILTSRTNFFPCYQRLLDMLSRFSLAIPVEKEGKTETINLRFANTTRLVYVEPLNESQIEEYIGNRTGDKAPQLIETLRTIHDLSDLSTRPVLLDMIVTTLPQLQDAKQRINSAALYEHYTDRWSLRDQWRVKMPLGIRQEFCEVLAWQMWRSAITELGEPLLEAAILHSLQSVTGEQDHLEQFKNDIRTCSFLVREKQGDQYRFAHKSFVEFFVAKRLIRNLTEGKDPSKEGTLRTRPKDNPMTWQDVFVNWHDDMPYTVPAGMSKYSALGVVFSDRLHRAHLFHLLDKSFRGSEFPLLINTPGVGDEHFTTAIKQVFEGYGLKETRGSLPITEEIATFALECMENAGITLQKVMEGNLPQPWTELLPDILRLARSKSLAKEEAKFIFDYLRTGANQQFKAALCALIARTSVVVDSKVLKQLKESLPTTVWSYLLFELSSMPDKPLDLITECYSWPNLSTVDRLICIYSMEGSVPYPAQEKVYDDLVQTILNTQDEEDKNLSLSLVSALNMPTQQVIKLVSEVLHRSPHKSQKLRAVEILRMWDDETMWRATRVMALRENDPEIKKRLQEIEQAMLDARSAQKSKVSWRYAKKDHAIRDALWRSLRT